MTKITRTPPSAPLAASTNLGETTADLHPHLSLMLFMLFTCNSASSATQYHWSTWSGLPPGIWEGDIPLRTTARGLCLCLQQLWMQWRVALSGFWVHKIQWGSWYWGSLPLHCKRWHMQVLIRECGCPGHRIYQHHPGEFFSSRFLYCVNALVVRFIDI